MNHNCKNRKLFRGRNWHNFCSLAVFIFVCSGCKPSQEASEQSAAARPASPQPVKSFAELLQQAQKKSGAPCLAGVVVRSGEIIEQGIVGIRRIDQPESIASINDRFHIGSVGKSMTATMIGKLVEDGYLSWDITLSKVFPDIEMRSEYRDVTLAQLLRHRGGIPSYTTDESDTFTITINPQHTPTQQRAAFAAHVLQEKPVIKPGTAMVYSNAGYSLAAHICERITKQPWESLLRTNVFEPLDMKTADFGWPATPQRDDQPRGHVGRGASLQVRESGDNDLDHYMAPAGNIHCSMPDLARYAAMHLAGLRGKNGVVSAATVSELHKLPGSAQTKNGYAAGWMINRTQTRESHHWHAGSGGAFFAQVSIYPESDLAIVIAANCGPSAAGAISKLDRTLYKQMKNSVVGE